MPYISCARSFWLSHFRLAFSGITSRRVLSACDVVLHARDVVLGGCILCPPRLACFSFALRLLACTPLVMASQLICFFELYIALSPLASSALGSPFAGVLWGPLITASSSVAAGFQMAPMLFAACACCAGLCAYGHAFGARLVLA